MPDPLPPPPPPAALDHADLQRKLTACGIADLSAVPEVDVTRSPYRERLQRHMSGTGGPVFAKIARQWYTFSDIHQVSPNVVYNPGPGDAFYGMSWEDRTSITLSLELTATVTAGIKGIVSASMTTTMGTSWTSEHASGENVQVQVLPDYFAWIDRGTLINNVEGEFIWPGGILAIIGSPGGIGGSVFLPFDGADRQQFRWKGNLTGPGKVGAMTGVLITSQQRASSTAVSRLQDLTGTARESGDPAGSPVLSHYALPNGDTSVTRDILT